MPTRGRNGAFAKANPSVLRWIEEVNYALSYWKGDNRLWITEKGTLWLRLAIDNNAMVVPWVLEERLIGHDAEIVKEFAQAGSVESYLYWLFKHYHLMMLQAMRSGRVDVVVVLHKEEEVNRGRRAAKAD